MTEEQIKQSLSLINEALQLLQRQISNHQQILKLLLDEKE